MAFNLAMKAIVMPLLGAPVINPAYHDLAGNDAALPGMMVVVSFGAGAKITIVVLASVLFGLIHDPVQGFAGAEQATITGLVFGTIFAITGRIFTPMIARAAFDVAAVLIIYYNLESYIAHLVFR